MALGPRARLESDTDPPSAQRLPDGGDLSGSARSPVLDGVGPSLDGLARAQKAEDVRLIADFNELIARYQNPLYNLIFQWIGDKDEAADLTQDTFVAAYKARDQFRGESRVYTWLYRIAHNQCKNRFKQRDRQRRMEGDSLDAGWVGEESDGSVTMEVADWSFSPDRLLDKKELRAAVNRAIDGLAFEYREVLILRDMEELSYAEISEVTGLTMENVKTRLNRARTMVRKRVEPYLKT